MRAQRRLGTLCIFLGVALLLGALGLWVFNARESTHADGESRRITSLLSALIDRRLEQRSGGEEDPLLSGEDVETGAESNLRPYTYRGENGEIPVSALPSSEDQSEANAETGHLNVTMDEVLIEDNPYIGVLSVPSLGLDLPIMAGWDYYRLRIAPCRYTGTVLGNDLVLCAHNYASHFGRFPQLSVGDDVYFTDVNGLSTHYKVEEMEIVQPYDLEYMVDSGYDLTLFTCTYGGKTRFTVRCSRA